MIKAKTHVIEKLILYILYIQAKLANSQTIFNNDHSNAADPNYTGLISNFILEI